MEAHKTKQEKALERGIKLRHFEGAQELQERLKMTKRRTRLGLVAIGDENHPIFPTVFKSGVTSFFF